MDNASSRQLADQLFQQAVRSYEAGRRPEAVALARRALQQQSDHAGALYLIGGAALDDQHADEALPYLEAAARHDGRHPDIQRALGIAHLSLKHWAPAADNLRRALAHYPQDAGLLNNLGIAYKELGDADAAIQCYQRALQFNQKDAHIYNNLGIALDKQRNYSAAIDAYQYSVQLDDTNPSVWSNLSVLLEQANRLEEADAAIERGLKLIPDHLGLNLIAAKCLRRRHDPEGAIRRLEPLVARATADKGDRRAAEFELGRDYDALGETELAFKHFESANRLVLEVWPELTESARAYDAELDRLLDRFTATWVKTWLPRSHPRTHSKTQRVDFLVGFLRSGTTLMDTLLGTHPGIAVLEEELFLENTLNRLRQTEPVYPQALAGMEADAWDALRHEYHQAITRHLPTTDSPPRVLDKNPMLSAQAGYIHALLPDARFLFALRHPCDVILSCYMQSFGGSSVLGNFIDLEASARTYRRVMELWLRYCDLFSLSVHELRYETLVTEPRATLRAAFTFLGLDEPATAGDHITHARDRGRIYTPSYYQVIEPVNTKAVGRWRRYASHFGSALEILRPYIDRFGYTL